MRVAVTGCTSDFGTAILPALFADPEIEEVVGTGRTREPRVTDPKLRFERHDVRSPELKRCFAGCDVVVHLAFAVEELHDKEQAHDINLGGTENVIRCAHAAGVGGLVIASSVSAYGVHDWPEFITEDAFPRGNHDRYYFYDKAEVEHFVEWWAPRHPEMRICLLRPPFVVGPAFSNSALSVLGTPALPYPDPDGGAIQMLHERDLASAFHLAVKHPTAGAYNIGPVDCIHGSELAEIHGQWLVDVPEKPLRAAADLLFALRLLPGSGDWVLSGEAVVDSGRFRRETGWSPSFTTRELAHVTLLHQGRGIVRTTGELERHEVAEAALEPSTRAVARLCDELPQLRELIGGADEFDAALERVEHVFLEADDMVVHVELHRASGRANGAVLVKPGLGLHARLYAPAAAALARTGVDVAVLDLPGHGLSTGPRGHSPSSLAARAVEAARDYAEEQLAAPLRVVGDAAASGLPARPLALLSRLVPRAPIPLRPLLAVLGTAVPGYVSDLLKEHADPLACRWVSAGTALGCWPADTDAMARELSFAEPLPRPTPSAAFAAGDAESLRAAEIA